MAYQMPSGKWRAEKMVNGKRHTRSFDNKADAKVWEAVRSIEVERTAKMKTLLPEYQQTEVDQLRIDFKLLAANPYNTVADIFDSAMEVLQLHFRFRDVMELAKSNKDKASIRPKIRMQVLERDGFTCQLCGSKAPDVKLEIDHIIPRSRGGLTEMRNLRVLCRDCNSGKSDSKMGRILIKMNRESGDEKAATG